MMSILNRSTLVSQIFGLHQKAKGTAAVVVEVLLIEVPTTTYSSTIYTTVHNTTHTIIDDVLYTVHFPPPVSMRGGESQRHNILLLRGAIVNKTYGIRKNLYI